MGRSHHSGVFKVCRIRLAKIIQREERFVRLNLIQAEINLKIDLINDVPSRVGEPWLHPILGRIDTAENMLANKITAVLDRTAPKDLADIWGLCGQMGLSLKQQSQALKARQPGFFRLIWPGCCALPAARIGNWCAGSNRPIPSSF